MPILTKVLLSVGLIVAATSQAFAEAPVALMEKFYAVADTRPFNSEHLAQFFGDEFTDHDASEPSSAKAVVSLYQMLASAAPDSRHVITFMEPVGETKVLVRWKYQGIQTAPLFGIPASGNRFDIAGMELWEFNQGKISGLWHVEELNKLFAQLGVKK